MTVISWGTYPVVYLFLMRGNNSALAVVSIQVGYCASALMIDHGSLITQLQSLATKDLVDSSMLGVGQHGERYRPEVRKRPRSLVG